MNKDFKSCKRNYGWAIPISAFLAFLICIDVEFQWLVFPCCSSIQCAKACNNIILGISYGYISATIFHYFIIYRPKITRQKELSHFISSNIRKIKELIRLSKISVEPPFNFTGENYTKDEYNELFEHKDLTEPLPFFTNKSIIERLSELRKEIEAHALTLLSYRDMLSDSQFHFINQVLSSTFIKEELRPNNDEYYRYSENQKEIGQSIYELYEYK